MSSVSGRMMASYFAAPLMVDTEYINRYTDNHKVTDGLHPIERRAACHAYAMEHLTPVILDDEPFVGTKTRYTRGAIPYCNYASGYMLRELDHLQQEAQDSVTEIGTGGGISISQQMVKGGKYVLFGKKFLLETESVPQLRQCAEYWRGKCMQDVSDDLWKQSFGEVDYIENGWKAVLYTAPHDPAPEGRLVLDYETGLARGLQSLIDEMAKKIKEHHVTDYKSAEKLYFWRAGIRALKGVIAWANNYANEADRLASLPTCTEENKKRLVAIAERCRRVPAYPPRNFPEAMQSFWFLYLAGHIEGAHLGFSPGRFDSYMYPYFKADREKGILPDETALEYLEVLRVKMTMLEYVASFSWEGLGSGNLFQNMVLGGLQEDGTSADNELSILVLQAAINCRTTQPTLSIWYDSQLSDKFLMKAAECVKTGIGFPAWFNFKVYAMHEMETTGLPLKLIRKYAAMGGCTEPTMQGMSYGIVQPGFVNHCKLLELAMNGGKDPRTGIQFTPTPIPTTYEQVLENYCTHMEIAIKNWQSYWNYVMAAHRNTCVLVYGSCLVRDCIGRGLSMDDCGALVNTTPTTLSTGMVNVANSLAVIKQLLNKKKCTFEELNQALVSNWEGKKELLEECMNVPKWGNNDDTVDSIFVSLWNVYCKYVGQGINYLGEKYDPSMLAISTHAPFGRACIATPDGRKCGETLADGVTSPFYGTDKSGPFSVLLSAAKADHTKIRGGLHNMKLHPSALRGAQGSRKLLDLIRTYFSGNAFQIQFNVVDSLMLKDAQIHPEKYRNLIVRVAGFSAFFVELSKPIQDEVILRTEHTLGSVPEDIEDTQ
eukprot:TRINITY_DN980_c0_g1_i2.p1 TRINITY_DN980_c0_g1~~TRINITY_DN980_c0_g1_i2.p1  ORF type:complete len:827 (+),score=245.73 TRINITY_DN980_c0_g1_i2:75-2555(+)